MKEIKGSRLDSKIVYTLECLEEDISPEDCFGDDQEQADYIISEYNAGNTYAWFIAKVTAKLEIDGQVFKGVDYLGGCSYKSEEDFKADPYYQSMMKEARVSLLAEIDLAVKRGQVAEVAKAGLVRK